MGSTPIYNLPREVYPSDPPGHTLQGGASGTSPRLADAVETELARIDADADTVGALVLPAYSTYTPSFTGTGGATFSTLVGRWKRIATATVHWRAYCVVDSAGSGSSNLQVDSPTEPDRSSGTRQIVAMNIERTGSPGDNLLMGHVVAFAGGSGVVWDRIRWQADDDGTLVNMTGADLISNMIVTIQGVYEEAT